MIFNFYHWDILILKFFNLSFHNALLNNISLSLTYLGVTTVYLVLIFLLYFFGKTKGKHIAITLLIVLVLTFCLTTLVKFIIARPRPYTEIANLIVVSKGVDPSFPSGHTSVSASMAYVLGKEYGYMYLFMIIPCIVGITRLYLGVHYPSDVIFGFILGICIAYTVEYGIKQLEFIKKILK